MKKKTFIVQLLDSKKPNKNSFTQVEDANFYSNDTDASLVFIPHEDTFNFETAKVVMYNSGDESLVERDMQVTTEEGRKVASYEMPDEIIAHWGEWVAQPVFISGGEIYSGSIVPFSVFRYLMHERPPRLNEVVTITRFIQQSQALVDDMAQKEAQRVTQEQTRQSAEAIRVQAESERSEKYGSYAQQFNDVITDLSEEKDYHSLPEISGARGGHETLGARLDDTTAQLAQKIDKDKGAVTSADLSQEVKDMMTGGDGSGYDDTSVVNHMNDRTNPHDVTKSQVGLGNVDDIKQASKTEFDTHNSDTTKHITASERDSWNSKQDALGFTPENTSNKGQAGGYAGLDATGRVPVSQLPDFEGGLGDSVDNVTLKNLVTNGDFSDGLLEWDSYREAVIEVVDSRLKVSTSISRNSGASHVIDSPYETGDAFYKYFNVDNPNDFAITLNAQDARGADYIEIAPNFKGPVSAIRIAKDTAPNFTYYIIKDAISDEFSFFVDDVVILNLTDIYGAGNEPTKEEMDEIINVTGYIDGEYTLNGGGSGGSSSAEVKEARVDTEGLTNETLKARLDKEHNEITTKLSEVGVNVKVFGAVGDGVADDTEAIMAGISYAMANQLALFIPPGIFMIRPNVLVIDVYDDLYIYGVGELSQIKVFDGLNNSKWYNMFHLQIIEDVDKIEIKNLLINQNASGTEPPETPYGYEQAHTFRVNVSETKTLKEIMYENVRINDPVADGFNNSGGGTVELYKVFNCKVTNRARPRSDIQFSTTPSEVLISNFHGDVIESESLNATKTNIRIDNTIINRLDGAPGQLGTIYMTNTTVKEGAYFGGCKLIIDNSEITVRPANLRWNKLIYGSKITNSNIYLPYDPVENIVSPLDIRCYGEMEYQQGITFENCDFLINSEDKTIMPSGYLINDEAAEGASAELKSIKRFINCSFDTRAGSNVKMNRSGNWYFDKCSFSGREHSMQIGTSFNYFVDVHINDADYSNVTGYAFNLIAYGIADGHSLINLHMTGYAKGENSTNYTADSTGIDRLVSERTLIYHSGVGGIKGDRKSSDIVDYIGEVATTSSPTNATWKKYGAIEL